MRMELYVHKDIQEQFSKEVEPNKLINNLLREHYDLEKPTRITPSKPPKEWRHPDKDFDFCKHNQVRGFCKKGC